MPIQDALTLIESIGVRYNQNPEQIYPIELNTDKTLPIMLLIVVDNYIPLRWKKIKGEYFSPLPLSLYKLGYFLKRILVLFI